MNKIAIVFVAVIVFLFLYINVSYNNDSQEQIKSQQPEMPCHTEQECMQYCMQHPNETFCRHNEQFPGPCSTKEECDEYCSTHPYEPMCMREEEQVKLSIPFDKNKYNPEKFGIWPFCVHGGDHPEGHGGIDFELMPDTRILASADGVVEYIEPPERALHGWGYGVYISHSTGAVGYVCLRNVQVKEGDHVKKGDFLGNPCESDQGDYFIHFEVVDVIKNKRVCPIEYLDENFRTSLEEMFQSAHYPEQSKEPNICNCETIDLPQQK